MSVDEAKNRQAFVGYMMANNFLKCYETNDVHQPRFGAGYDELLHQTWLFVERIALMKSDKSKSRMCGPQSLGQVAMELKEEQTNREIRTCKGIPSIMLTNTALPD